MKQDGYRNFQLYSASSHPRQGLHSTNKGGLLNGPVELQETQKTGG